MLMTLKINNGETVSFYREDLEALMEYATGHRDMPTGARDFVLTDLVAALTAAEALNEDDTNADIGDEKDQATGDEDISDKTAGAT